MSFVNNLDDLFTHVEILNSRESESFNSNIQTPNSTIEEDLSKSNYIEMIQNNDFISLLKVGWNKNQGKELDFNTLHDPKNGIDEIEEQLLAGEWTTTAKDRNKKKAQQKAAANVLLKIVESGKHKKYLIPGNDANEARELIITAMNKCFEQSTTGGTASHIQTNWVGRLQEYVMKRPISNQLKEEYQQIGPANLIEHKCRLKFFFLDGPNKDKVLEGIGQERNKKAAKHIAAKKILDQLIQLYGGEEGSRQGGVLSEMAATTPNKKTMKTVQPGKIRQEPKNTAASADTVPSENRMEHDQCQEKRASPEVDDEELRLHLSEILRDRSRKTAGAEYAIREILGRKDAKVERLFQQAELNFIESTKGDDYVQVYLEVLVGIGNHKQILCTFGGDGPNMQAARDDACWQALEFLYIFGEFTPQSSNSTEEG